MKKFLLSLGTISAIAAPIASVVSCGQGGTTFSEALSNYYSVESSVYPSGYVFSQPNFLSWLKDPSNPDNKFKTTIDADYYQASGMGESGSPLRSQESRMLISGNLFSGKVIEFFGESNGQKITKNTITLENVFESPNNFKLANNRGIWSYMASSKYHIKRVNLETNAVYETDVDALTETTTPPAPTGNMGMQGADQNNLLASLMAQLNGGQQPAAPATGEKTKTIDTNKLLLFETSETWRNRLEAAQPDNKYGDAIVFHQPFSKNVIILNTPKETLTTFPKVSAYFNYFINTMPIIDKVKIQEWANIVKTHTTKVTVSLS